MKVLVQAGFAAVKLDKWDTTPWQTIEGIEFRSVTVTAVKGEGKDCIDRGHAVIYHGPYGEVRDEEGHIFPHGKRIAVCERTCRTITEGPYKDDFIGIEPYVLQEPMAWCAPPGTRRPVQVSKRGRQIVSNCENGNCCQCALDSKPIAIKRRC